MPSLEVNRTGSQNQEVASDSLVASTSPSLKVNRTNGMVESGVLRDESGLEKVRLPSGKTITVNPNAGVDSIQHGADTFYKRGRITAEDKAFLYEKYGVDTSTETSETFDEETGQFCVDKNTCFDMSSVEGRQKFIEYLGLSKDNQVLKDVQAYIRKHHPDGNVAEILGKEIINTILAGFFSGRTATGGAGPLTSFDKPPSIWIEVDEDTATFLAKAIVSLIGHGVSGIRGLIDSAWDASIGQITRPTKEIAAREEYLEDQGALVSKKGMWGSIPSFMHSWFEITDNGDGTLYVGKKGAARFTGELIGDAAILLIGPGKAKQLSKSVVESALKKLPKDPRQRLVQALVSARQVKLGMGKPIVPMPSSTVRKLLKEDYGGPKSLGITTAAKVQSIGQKTIKAVSWSAPYVAEWTAAEALADQYFDKYGVVFGSEELRDTWKTWFAFNYVWADLTIQAIDAVLPLIWSIQGSSRGDVKSIGGQFLKLVAAEILTGAQIIAGVGITKIQQGDITWPEYLTHIINLDFQKAGFDKPITSNDILRALSGEPAVGTEPGGNFDVIQYGGRTYTVQPQTNSIIDEEGNKVPRGSAMGGKIWEAWKQQVEGKTAGEQTLNMNDGGLIALNAKPIRSYYDGGLVAL